MRPEAKRVMDAHDARKDIGRDIQTMVIALMSALLLWPLCDSFDEAAGAILTGGTFGYSVHWCGRYWRERRAERALAAALSESGATP